MKSMSKIRRQLRAAGFTNNYWGWSAVSQLPAILDEDETIERVITGFYPAGHAVLIATDKRILFLDKKPISFKVEDIHYEMISEVEHRFAILYGVLRIHTLSKTFELKCMQQSKVRLFAVFVEHKVNEIRFNIQTWSQMMETANQPPNQNVQNPNYRFMR